MQKNLQPCIKMDKKLQSLIMLKWKNTNFIIIKALFRSAV